MSIQHSISLSIDCSALTKVSAGLTAVANVVIVKGSALLGALCVKFVPHSLQQRILEFRCPRQTLSEEVLHFAYAIKQVKFLILSKFASP